MAASSFSAKVPDTSCLTALKGRGGAIRRRSAALPAIYVLFCVVSLLPFFAVQHPPIVDFANHAARLSLACSIDDPLVAAIYTYHLGIIPNLAADVVNVPICGRIAPDMVLKGLIAASLALIYVSGWLIQRSLFGQANAFLLLLPALSFNLVVSTGYINFLAGTAVTIALAALALRFQGRRAALVVIGNVGGTVVFFSHIFALVFAALLFFGLELRRMPRSVREVVVAGGRTLGMLALPLLLVPLVPSGGSAVRAACGRITRRSVCQRVMPMLAAASHVR